MKKIALAAASVAAVAALALTGCSGSGGRADAGAFQAAAAGFADQTPDNQAVSLINGPAPDGYPIVNYEYAIVNANQSDAATAQTLQAFLHWAITDGNSAEFLDRAHLQPLPDAVVKSSLTQIISIHAG